MDKSMFISVILPVFNVEKYIKQCLESVLMQRGENFEIIVVDDESTDNTMAVVKQLEQKNQNIRTFSVPHGGQARAREFAIEKAAGNYITFIDGDDYWEEDHLSRLCQVLRKEDPDVCVGNQYYIVRGESKTQITLFDVPYGGKTQGKEVIFQNINLPGSMCLLCCKKSFLKEYGITFHEEYVCNEDFDFFMQIMSNECNVSTICYPYYNYRKDNITSTYYQSSGKKMLAYMVVYRKWYDFYLSSEINENYKDNILRGIQNNYRCAIDTVKNLPHCDSNRKNAMNYLAQTQYILWPDEKEKRFFRLYLVRRDITQRVKNWLLCMAGRVKRIVG